MKTVLQLAGVICLMASAFFFLTLSKAVVSVTKHVNQTLSVTGDAVKKLDLDLDEIHRLTLEAGLTAMEARKASKKESVFLDSANVQLLGMASQSRSTLASLQSAIETSKNQEMAVAQSTTQAIDSLPPLVHSTTLEVAQLRSATQHLDQLLADPALPATMSAVQDTSAHLAATSKDVEDAVRSYVHPTWAHKIFNWTLAVVHALSPI